MEIVFERQTHLEHVVALHELLYLLAETGLVEAEQERAFLGGHLYQRDLVGHPLAEIGLGLSVEAHDVLLTYVADSLRHVARAVDKRDSSVKLHSRELRNLLF